MEVLSKADVEINWVVAPKQFPETPQDINIREDIENAYYKQVLNHEILTRREERALLEIRKTGVTSSQEFAKERLKGSLRKDSKRYDEYVEKINLGFRAEKNIIRHNMRLVMKRVLHYVNLYPTSDIGTLTTIDLMQEGTEGLIRAIARFDYNRGCKLSTYAVSWIDKYIVSSLKKDREYAKGIFPYKSKKDDENEEIIKDDENEETLLENVQSTEITPEKYTAQRMVEENLMSSLLALNSEERRIIILRFGKGLSLKEVGKLEGCSYESIRQIQNIALDKLRKILVEPDSLPSNDMGRYITV